MSRGPRFSARFSAAVAVSVGSLHLVGCEGDGDLACVEDSQAQVLEEQIPIVVAGEPRTAELADSEVERERGWRHRICGLEALVLLPAQREALPVWGCELTRPVDLVFVRDGVIVEVVDELAPCTPCSECALVGADVEVDAVVELPAGSVDIAVGDPVDGLPNPGSG